MRWLQRLSWPEKLIGGGVLAAGFVVAVSTASPSQAAEVFYPLAGVLTLLLLLAMRPGGG